MSGLHYKKDGSLDMRYSSSRQATPSSYGSSMPAASRSSASYSAQPAYSNSPASRAYAPVSSGYSAQPSMCQGQSSSQGLVHKKDGSLDMRYASSRQAVQSSTVAAERAQSSRYSAPSSTGLVLKKDGSLDMRYASSKQAVDYAPHAFSGYATTSYEGQELHHKKDGSLDMRYASSKDALSGALNKLRLSMPSSTSSSSGLVLKIDGTPDLRYKSSQHAPIHSVRVKKCQYNIPEHIPTKTDGTPDMRTNAAKQWVTEQARRLTDFTEVPAWIPTRKDGTVDGTKPLARAFLSEFEVTAGVAPNRDMREAYWQRRMVEPHFQKLVNVQRKKQFAVLPKEEPLLNDTAAIRQYFVHLMTVQERGDTVDDLWGEIPENARKFEYNDLVPGESHELGRGGFGQVFKGNWDGMPVAIKKLFTDRLSKGDKKSFIREICLISYLGSHPNLIEFYGYCTDPPAIVMELAELGSLSFLLHYCEDPELEAKMTDGRLKKNLTLGIVHGMKQLHAVGVIHQDLKPQNILVTRDFIPKITDFGLALMRGKASLRSKLSEDDESVGHICGTAGYMAPELLDSTKPADFPVDVYSFGILLNEFIAEEEPFGDQLRNFLGRGPFGVVNYAKLGGRPTIRRRVTTDFVKDVIVSCWSANPAQRPTFSKLGRLVADRDFVIPDSC